MTVVRAESDVTVVSMYLRYMTIVRAEDIWSLYVLQMHDCCTSEMWPLYVIEIRGRCTYGIYLAVVRTEDT